MSALAAADVSRLDALGQQRALTSVESLRLERAICLSEGKPIPKGLTRDLARFGVKRDMRHFGGGA
jgi:hypothetical protein